MKNFFLVSVFLLTAPLFAQGEFEVYSNGLIYDEQTVGQLKGIVDSLNLKFRTCDPNKKYYSKSQAVAGYFHLKEDGVKEAIADIEAGMTFSELAAKYPGASALPQITVVRDAYKNYDDKDVVEFSGISLNPGGSPSISFVDRPEMYTENYTGKWVFLHAKKSEYSTERVSAFYFPEGFSSFELPDNYSSMVQYGECMVDTNHTIYTESTGTSAVGLPEKYHKLSMKEKQTLLNNMRGTKVYGMCSMDDSPRRHALGIAILAAETASWEIFLRAHLDIMNDRFDRRSDGSYAWAQRQTYIRELEVLDINIIDLVVGISLRIDNPSDNHYYGNISRLGRAIAESAYAADFEQITLTMIKDSTLDDYNRIIAYYLLLNYNFYIEDETKRTNNQSALDEAVNHLPEYIRVTKPANEKE